MKVTIDYLFSKNNKIGSRLIRWGTAHLAPEIDYSNVPSHVAILINNRWVFESTLSSGVRVIVYSKWLEINEEVSKIPYQHKEVEYKHIKKIFKDINQKKYDWAGVSYLGLQLGKNKFLNLEISRINKWENKDRYFCSEAVATLIGMENHSMKAPVQMLDYLRKTHI